MIREKSHKIIIHHMSKMEQSSNSSGVKEEPGIRVGERRAQPRFAYYSAGCGGGLVCAGCSI